jgi:glycosyltransferase involved in cell wall biosynthesis
MKKKRLLVVSEVFYPEDFLINDLVDEWTKDGYKVEVLTRNPSYPYGRIYKGYKNKLYQKDKVGQAVVHRIHFISGYKESAIIKVLNYLWNALLALVVALFIGKRFDRVFIYQTGPLTFALPGAIISKFFGKKTIIWTQDIWPDSVFAYGINQSKVNQFLLSTFVRFVYKNCSHILVSSKGFIPKIKNYVPHKEIGYVPQWSLVDYKGYNKEKHVFSNYFNFTFAGNIGKVQNLENVIHGFGNFAQNNNNVRLNIIGDGSNLDSLKSLVSKFAYSGIVFHGRKPLDQMPSYLLSSTVLIISLQNKEIFKLTIPAKFQAYLSAKKPLMCVMLGEVKEMVDENKLGLTCHPDDIEAISNTFQKFVNMSDEEREVFSVNASLLEQKEYKRDDLIYKITQVVF